MIRSMTGYGRCETVVDGRAVTVELKSVNHRYFEFSCRTTRGYSFLEEKMKSYLQGKISRGKVDAYISVEALESAEAQVLVNHPLASGYVHALRELAERYDLQDDISVSTVARYSDIFSVHKSPEDEDAVWASVQKAADEALEQFLKMREAEGQRLKADVLSRADTIMGLVGQIEARSPQTVAEYRERLQQKMEELWATPRLTSSAC